MSSGPGNDFDRQRLKVLDFLDAFLRSKRKSYARINTWGPDALAKLGPFIRTGKMLRSGLVALGAETGPRAAAAAAVRAGAAVELIQAALLIHDDIIDRDEMRRGRPSLHYEYALQGRKSGTRDPLHFGEGMGICLADIAFFLAFELFSTLPVPRAVRAEIVSLWSHELCLVGLAQMQDLYLGEATVKVRPDDIIRLYLYKTARYSFSVPLLTGAKLSGAPRAIQARLDRLGESLGVLFQLKDDDLGLFGSEGELGKPVGSDIRECKQTLLSYVLFSRAKTADRKRLKEIFGNPRITPAMVEEVKDMVERLGVRRVLSARMRRLRLKAVAGIRELPAGGRPRRVLGELVEFSIDRRK
jgi:geranylgeranyl diphosphate synthase type I